MIQLGFTSLINLLSNSNSSDELLVPVSILVVVLAFAGISILIISRRGKNE